MLPPTWAGLQALTRPIFGEPMQQEAIYIFRGAMNIEYALSARSKRLIFYSTDIAVCAHLA